MRDTFNIIPMFNAGAVHAAIVASIVFAFDWSPPVTPQVPLAIKGSVITDFEIPERPEPEPEPEPEQPEPEPEQPEPERDTSEQERLRIEAEERKRQEDLARERERIAREEEAERRRQEQAEAERKRREEAELERRRQEAERQRLEEIERQRIENERRRREAEEAELERRRQQEIEAEENRLAAMNADDEARYVFAIQQRITRNFIRPASAPANVECVVNVRQIPGGQVTSVEIVRCNGDDAVRRSVEAAVYKASPLPMPDNPNIFRRDLQIIFKPEQ